MAHVHTTLKSNNLKTGEMPVTTSEASTCPVVCPFNHANEGGCYADAGPLKLHWDKVSRHERGEDWLSFIKTVESFAPDTKWRHNQAGDLPGNSYTLDARKCEELARANGNRSGFTYTHYDVLTSERNHEVVRGVNTSSNFTINLSANNMAHADELVATDAGPVCTVLPIEYERRHARNGEWTETLSDYRQRTANLQTPAGNDVKICPATYMDSVTCKSCMLCAKKNRKVAVGFPAHGTSARKANAVAAN